MTSKYTIRGVTDEVTTCECCGRKDLKRTVALADQDDAVVFFGTECAAQALLIPAADVTKQARKAQAAAQAKLEREKQKKAEAEFCAWASFLRTRTGLSDLPAAIQALGGFAAARREFLA